MGSERQSVEQLSKALDTAERLDDLDAQAWALLRLYNYHIFRAEHDKAWAASQRLSQVASRIGDLAATLSADRVAGNVLLMLGRPREAREFLNRALNADGSTMDQRPRFGFPMDHRGPTRGFLSRAFWLLGLLDQARLEAQASLDEVRATDHPSIICRVLYFGMCRILHLTGDFATAEKYIALLIDTAAAINSLFFQTAGRLLSGKLMIEQGAFVQGVAVLNDAFDVCHRAGWRMSHPEFNGALAVGLAGLGRLDEAFAAVNEALDGAAQCEHGRDLFFAELLRVKGEILLQRGAVSAAEGLFREALNVAQQQEAMLWELRAALSLARVRANQGRGDEARWLVAQVYDRFTEGFAAPDLRAAKAFLDELPG